MPEYIQALSFRAFRGLRNHQMDLGKGGVIVCGPNGCGKSAIVDAIEFFFRGDIGRFHGVGMSGVKFKDAVPHIECDQEDTEVRATFQPTNQTVIRQFSDTEWSPPDLHETVDFHLRTHPEAAAFVLRREEILRFITFTDKDRYARFIDLMSLSELNNQQEAFNLAQKETQDKAKTQKEKLNTLLEPFRDESSAVPESSAVLLLDLETRVRKHVDVPITTWDDFEKARVALEKLQPAELTRKLTNLSTAKELFSRQAPHNPGALIARIAALEGELQREEKKAAETNALEVIVAGRDYLERYSPDFCPVCEQPLVDDYSLPDVLESLKKREADLQRIQELRETLAAERQNLEQRLRAYRVRLAEYDTLNQNAFADKLWIEIQQHLSACTTAIDEAEARQAEPAVLPNLESQFSAYERHCEQVTQWLQDDIDRQELAGEVDIGNVVRLVQRAMDDKDRILATEEALMVTVRLAEQSKAIQKAFSKARQNAIQDIFDEVATKVAEYYTYLHTAPGGDEKSECDAIDLQVSSRSKSGSLGLQIKFLSRDQRSHPRAYLSEGHEDSLGLCIFLATVKLFNPPGTLIVLDDVLTSIDQGHKTRVAHLLLNEFADYQLVLTTHDEHWFDAFQQKVQAVGRQRAWKFHRIKRWTLEGGPEGAALDATWSHVKTNLVEEEYRFLGGPLRVLLEDFLKRVSDKLGVRVRFKADARYTANDFIAGGFCKALKKELLAKEPEEEKAIDSELMWVFGDELTNILSHDKVERLEVSLDEVTGLVNGLESLITRCERHKLIKGTG